MALRLVFCVLLVLCLAITKVNCATCPDGWTSHEEDCYLFKKETYNWFNAMRVCTMLGGYLAVDDSITKHQFLKGLIQSNGATDDYTWLGLEDFAEENLFVWAHSGEEARPSFWRSHEPGDDHGEEDCGAMQEGGWLDLNCENYHEHFICQKPSSEDGVIIG